MSTAYKVGAGRALTLRRDGGDADRAGMARGFEQVVYRCLEKDPGRRFAGIAQLAAALEPFEPAVTRGRAQRLARVLSARPVSVPGTPWSAGPSAPTTLGSSAVSIERAPAVRSLRGVLLAAVVVGGIAAATVVMLRARELSHEPRAETPTLPAASASASGGGGWTGSSSGQRCGRYGRCGSYGRAHLQPARPRRLHRGEAASPPPQQPTQRRIRHDHPRCAESQSRGPPS